MKNITVSVPDDVYHAARVKAAELHTSVSALVREQLTQLAAHAAPDRRGQRLLATIERIRRERAEAGTTGLDMSENLTREELYDRDALRRHQRSDL